MLRFIHAWNALALVALLATGWLADAFERGPNEALLWDVAHPAGLWPHHRGSSRACCGDWWALAMRVFPICGTRGHGSKSCAGGDSPRRGASATTNSRAWPISASTRSSSPWESTGLALAAIEHGVGPLSAWLGDCNWLKKLFKEPHEAISTALALFVGVHLIALVVHEWLERNHLARSMLTGIQFRRREQSDRG